MGKISLFHQNQIRSTSTTRARKRERESELSNKKEISFIHMIYIWKGIVQFLVFNSKYKNFFFNIKS